MSTWILLRGLMREARHWGDFPAQLQKITGAQKVVTLDFPGNGSLHAQASRDSVAEMAESCRTQLERLGYRPPYNVLALSLGAMVAVAWSERYPQELARMVLINTSLAPYNPFYQRMRPRNYPGLMRFLVFNSIPARERSVLRITSNRERTVQQRQTLLDQWESYARTCPVSRTNILRQLRAAASFRAAATPPVVPVLLLSGPQDNLVNAKCSLTLAQRWGCPIRLHPTAGHDIPLDDGEWVAQQVRDWMAA
ncbi:MAG: alpha/beta hydrolase [Nitrosomonadales bacterium]|nr:alpha/beta hydrolase [Nitrosomonadales bacterium]